MNKELIKKHKAAFEHWLNGGRVLSKYTLFNRWSDCQDEDIWRIPDKDISKVLIVIDDEYVEFRKAMAEGKTIQCNAREGENDISYTAYGHTWWENTTEFKYATTFYRIKPEEPKFQVGDWITDGIEVWQHKENCRVKDQSSWSLWKPKTGEWCWVYGDITKIPVLRKFVCFDSDLNAPFKYIVENHDGRSTIPFKFVEPFIGVLPSRIEKY